MNFACGKAEKLVTDLDEWHWIVKTLFPNQEEES